MNGVCLVEHAFMQAQVLAEAMGVCIDDVRWQDFTPTEVERIRNLARERIRAHICGDVDYPTGREAKTMYTRKAQP